MSPYPTKSTLKSWWWALPACCPVYSYLVVSHPVSAFLVYQSCVLDRRSQSPGCNTIHAAIHLTHLFSFCLDPSLQGDWEEYFLCFQCLQPIPMWCKVFFDISLKKKILAVSFPGFLSFILSTVLICATTLKWKIKCRLRSLQAQLTSGNYWHSGVVFCRWGAWEQTCLCHLLRNGITFKVECIRLLLTQILRAENQWSSGSSSQNSRWDEVRQKYVAGCYFFQSSRLLQVAQGLWCDDFSWILMTCIGCVWSYHCRLLKAPDKAASSGSERLEVKSDSIKL